MAMTYRMHTTGAMRRGPARAASARALGTRAQRGFALLIAVIFMSVMLTLGLTLGSLAYKQEVIASSAIESQYAFYAADAGLECALYADQQENLFSYDPSTNVPPQMTCDGSAPESSAIASRTASQWVIRSWLALDNNTRCAEVTVYKPATTGTTYLFSQGYDTKCTVVQNPGNARFVARGLEAHY